MILPNDIDLMRSASDLEREQGVFRSAPLSSRGTSRIDMSTDVGGDKVMNAGISTARPPRS